MKKKFDVVIAGAGPAGLACARQLADSRLSVLILDKNNVPAHKICAGGVRICDLEELGLLPEKVRGCDVLTVSDFGEILNFTTIDRIFLEQTQLKLLDKAANIEKMFGWMITDVLPNEIIIQKNNEKKSIGFDYLIGADGAASKVRKKLGVTTNNELLANLIQVDLPLDEKLNQYNTLTFFFDETLFGKWYGYIFPHRGLKIARAGCGGSIAWIKKEGIDLRHNMAIWLKNLDINHEAIPTNSALINADYQGFDFTSSPLGKVFLCGDAAGFAFYYSGEGIHQALVSGKDVGNLILDKTYVPEGIRHLISLKEKHFKQEEAPNEKHSLTEMIKKGVSFLKKFWK